MSLAAYLCICLSVSHRVYHSVYQPVVYLDFLLEEKEYTAIFFIRPCEEDDPCDDILEELVFMLLMPSLVSQSVY